MILLLMIAQLHSGYLSVQADQDSLPIYVDDDYIGVTPIVRYPLAPDEYNVGFFPQDSIEQASWRLKEGSISALWAIAKYGEGTAKVKIAPDAVSAVKLNYKDCMAAPGKAKLKVGACLGGVFLLGFGTALLLQAVF
ncbi:MAG: hypothetical protein OEV79_10945 [candidate division WOR-3 bacterium]|nr:hypothetical protein [candidate division WOR-3 bacterium]